MASVALHRLLLRKSTGTALSSELTQEGQTTSSQPGSSWIVPKGAEHSYRILEAFTAIEATTPPAEVHDREAKQRSG
ncbi:MAG: hypothetical protein JOZ17_07870 [Acetobacteraceae bacterium]|nr:hypothetical protein [Acetobacteraceae bacterium]